MTRRQKAELVRATLEFAAKIAANGISGPGPEKTADQAVGEVVTCLKGHAAQAEFEIQKTGRYRGVDAFVTAAEIQRNKEAQGNA